MKGSSRRENCRALAAQDADADEIADSALDSIASSEVLALVDLAGQLTDRELGWVLSENEA